MVLLQRVSETDGYPVVNTHHDCRTGFDSICNAGERSVLAFEFPCRDGTRGGCERTEHTDVGRYR